MSRDTDARERYISLATLHFAERGYSGASLAQIAKEAGVSKQALLHFFGTKERLYADVLSALTQRLMADLDRSKTDDAERWLSDYFDRFALAAFADPTDARLVLRALLDSDAAARQWPVKAYLDALIALGTRTTRWQASHRDDVLADLYHTIGAVLCAAISTPTLRGMYGNQATKRFARRQQERVKTAF